MMKSETAALVALLDDWAMTPLQDPERRDILEIPAVWSQ
jgi:hypothetical protein